MTPHSRCPLGTISPASKCILLSWHAISFRRPLSMAIPKHQSPGPRMPTKTKYPGKFNLLKTLQREEQLRLDVDGRSSLFSIESPNYCPSGSLLRVFYYSLPLPSGVSFPLTPIKFNEDTHHLWNEKGKLPLPQTSTITFSPEDHASMISTPPSSFWGMLLATHRNSVDSTFLLRNVIDGVPVEMSFQMFSPLIVGVQVLRRARQGRSRIYWMRERPFSWIYKKDLPTEAELNHLDPFYKEPHAKEPSKKR